VERKPFEQRFKNLQTEAESWQSAWKDIKKYLAPTRGNFNEEPNKGKAIDHQTIIDGHASRALNILASGMTSGLTSPSRPWFKIGLADNDLSDFNTVKLWLNTVQERMMAVFSRSNIYGALHSIYYEIGAFGTASAILLEDFKDVIRCRSYTTGEYYLSIGPDGRVNGFARRYYMTVGQLVAEFGKSKLSLATQALYDGGNIEKWVKVFCLIEVNDTRIIDRADFKGMPYRSAYWEESAGPGVFLRVSGFNDFPILAPRWDVATTYDVYGRSPGWDGLGDIKMLQKMQRDKLIALDKVVDPPVQADSSVDGDPNTLPGGLSRSSATAPNAGVKAIYQINPDFNALENSIDKTRAAISQTFYSDLFMMIANADRANMTAREIVERHEEKLLMLGPVLERLESELLDPLIERTFNIMVRAGIIPQPPEELQGADLKVEYISMLAQAQKMVGTTAIEQTVVFAGNLMGAFPEVKDVLDADSAVREYSDLVGVSPKILRSREQVDKIREERAKAAEAQKNAEGTGLAIQGAKLLSETKIGQGSALDALVAGSGR